MAVGCEALWTALTFTSSLPCDLGWVTNLIEPQFSLLYYECPCKGPLSQGSGEDGLRQRM